MVDHIKNRTKIIQALREELIGPCPQGRSLDWTAITRFETKDDANSPYYDKETNEEILNRDTPTVRYGVGVLYPLGSTLEDPKNESSNRENNSPVTEEGPQDTEDNSSNLIPEEAIEAMQSLQEIVQRSNRGGIDGDNNTFEVSTANAYKPSSMAISFLAQFPPNSTLNIHASGGRYEKKEVPVTGSTYPTQLWRRRPVSIVAKCEAIELPSQGNLKISPTIVSSTNIEGLKIQIEIFSRPQPDYGDDVRLLTVCLINRAEAGRGRSDDLCLFQSHFKVSINSQDGDPCILPYPSSGYSKMDNEGKSLSLLYLDKQTFAVGHGCAADWADPSNDRKTMWVSAETLPTYETPSITPDITKPDGSFITVSMAKLANLSASDDGFADLNNVIDWYNQWIAKKRQEVSLLSEDLQDTANRHLDDCERCSKRMLRGLQYLQNEPKALRAFRLANHAILLQQINTQRREPRLANYNLKQSRWEFSEPYQLPDPANLGSAGRGNWRAFQIAFLLMSIESTAKGDLPERETVELIWFPTGGGKTEAYLGLSAFAMFLRRLEDPKDSGVNILMRYTLRLLTAQQFQRASALICAMEYLRRQDEDSFGTTPFSIGIWLGGDTTPNNRKKAITDLQVLQRDQNAENPFILSRCPWCNAQMGKYLGSLPRGVPRVLGYEIQGNTVVFKCIDKKCTFTRGLPIYVIDEDIYENRPTLVIGTVDKFAMLAWRPKARSLFGIDSTGKRFTSPPSLIIQDELHLIAGPLGSMVGLYEVVIEELCTDYRRSKPVKPKLVCSTATIRRYSEQIKALYARGDTALFPPPGLNASDSFFSQYARDKLGKLLPGRMYLGVHAPGLGSMQTVEVRSFTSLIQAPGRLSTPEQDPWWTLLIFFNSLRELGTILTLFQSDIPDYIQVFKRRTGLKQVRYPYNYKELTSRLRSDEIPEAITQLEVTTDNTNNQKPVDTCLASNIIEVGIDIDRLSLMAVVGQPKTTSQYIQVTGRVGRRWKERPGLVVTLYGASKPRDRSHFEKFRSYHERLYAQVEPTSVTPFSPPALDRALHAVLAAYARQLGDTPVANSPYNYPADLLEQLKTIILDRVQFVDEEEKANTLKVFETRTKQWREWESKIWEKDYFNPSDDYPLLREAGDYADREWKRVSWPTPMSMRNVDAGCQAQITKLYLEGAGSDE
jgi:hypothetical protein